VFLKINTLGILELVREREEATMWSHEASAETTAAPEVVWRLWTDVENWPTWNGDIKRISIDGPFAPGARVSMTPFDQDPIELLITQAVENELFVDEAAIGDIVIRTFHRIEPASEGKVRIVYRMEISGPAAAALGPTLGPEITADFPDTIATLIEHAERASAGTPIA
jgi:uncharacterized protein YndB with AHSA1/START domain